MRARDGGRRGDGIEGGAVEEIRRDHDHEGLSIRALAERHGVHRRAVRQALDSALPPERKHPRSARRRRSGSVPEHEPTTYDQITGRAQAAA
ncbi:MAG: hypothetical protein WKF31_11560 [Thermoleophilaceae bacterium]